jgi:hypothetical protein
MDNINESSDTDKKGHTHGIPCEGLGSQATQNTHDGSPLKGETIVNVSETRGSDGSFQAPVPQIIKSVQKESRLGQKTVYEKMIDEDDEYINKIKRPTLIVHPHTNTTPLPNLEITKYS